MHLLALSGSLRAASTNTALLRAFAATAAPPVTVTVFDGLAQIPLFSPDREGDATPPQVLAFAHAVEQADGLVIACPEYVHALPGAFKNALDWLVGGLEFPGKPVALINASGRGSHHAQEALVEILRTMSATVLDGVSGTVPLPGVGCEAAWIVEQPTLRETLCALLARLDRALAQA